MSKAQVGLLITVDNGVGAFDEIALCRNLGIDVIVTDHHRVGTVLPECCAIVSATRKDSNYGNPHLCGAGAAFKLAQALLPNEDHSFDLALAAVATVADVVPLIGENRAIVAQGMEHVLENLGLCALLEAAGWKKEQTLNEQTLAFMVAPRLNAAGRMGDAMQGVELLLTTDPAEAAALAANLDAVNTARRQAENGIAEEALAQIDVNQRGLIAAHTSWNPGVIGIVASRLCETYHRPVILFSEENGVLTGSGRCPDSIDLFMELSKLSKYFIRFGGHARAAGITMAKDNYEPFCRDFLALMSECDSSCFLPACGYEEIAALSWLTLEQVDQLRILAPFGEGNPEPAYLLEQVRLNNVATMGKDAAHLSATVIKDDESMRLVAFRKGPIANLISNDEPYDLIAKAAVNRFRGKQSPELYYVALRPAGRADQQENYFENNPEPQRHPGSKTGDSQEKNIDETSKKFFDAIFVKAVYNSCGMDDIIAEWYFSTFGKEAAFYDLEGMRVCYSNWRRMLSFKPETPEALAKAHSAEMLIALVVFLQLGFFVAQGVMIQPNAVVENATLEQSRLYRLLTGIQPDKGA